MPDISVVPQTFPAYDREVNWPMPTALVGESYAWNLPLPSWQMNDSNPFVFTSDTQRNRILTSNSAGGGGVSQLQGVMNFATVTGSVGPVCRLRADAGAVNNRRYGFGGLGIPFILGGAALPPGLSLPSLLRVYWLRLYLAAPAAQPQSCRFLMCPVNDMAAGPTTPDQAVGPGNAGGFGIGGDGAGQWQYQSYDRSGVNLLRETVALPAHNIQQFNAFDMVLVNGRPGNAASWDFRWNGVSFATRGYAGTDLEPLAAASEEWGYYPVVQAQGAGIQASIIFRLNVKYGRFLPNGVEVQG